MARYTDEFKHNALDLMKRVGISQASRNLKIAQCTLRRWCRDAEVHKDAEREDDVRLDLGTDFSAENNAEASSPSPESQVLTESSEPPREGEDIVATALAMLVIENTHLREVIRHLRDTISGLTDHNLL